jgi:hypothetical protein
MNRRQFLRWGVVGGVATLSRYWVPVPIWDTPYYLGFETLLMLMAGNELFLYQMEGNALLAGPDGFVAANDVVLLKVNSQWAELDQAHHHPRQCLKVPGV